jgi:Right handed beta helix region
VRRLAQVAGFSVLFAAAVASAAWGSHRIGISAAKAIRPVWLARGVAVGRPSSRSHGPGRLPQGGGKAAVAPAPSTPPSQPQHPPLPACTSTVSSLAALGVAVGSASAGNVICLADGSYGALSLDAEKAGEVLVRALNPGAAHLAGADLDGSHLTLSSFDIGDLVNVMPGSDHIAIEHNRISGGEHGIQAAPTTDIDVSDVSIVGNRLVGPFGEDAIRLNRYHDGPDPDPYGILIEGNEITGVRENGNHSDCLQSVWGGDSLYFRRNYVHDNRCQGFFVKDQPDTVRGVVVEDNLFLRNAESCAPGAEGCGQPATFQVFGPMAGLTIRHNTIWTPAGNAPTAIRDGSWDGIVLEGNVIWRGFSDWTGAWTGYAESANTLCHWEGTLPALSATSATDCSPSFLAPAADDYRLAGGRGVSWAPGGQGYGF